MQSEQSARYRRKTVNMEELRQRQQNRRKRRGLFYIGLFFALFILFLAVCYIVFFRIKIIRIEGESRYSEEEILSALGIEMGGNLYFFSPAEKAAELEKALPYICETVIERNMPSGVVVRIKEKQPSMYLELKDETYLLTDTMQVLELTSDSSKLYGLLKVQMRPEKIGRCIVGEELSFTDARTGGVIERAFACIREASLENRVGYIDANSRFHISVGLDGKYRVFMGDAEHFDTKLAFAKGIADKLTSVPGGEGNGEIDVSNIIKGVFKPD